MQTTALDQMAWLHDSVVQSVIFNASTSDREIRLVVRCHPDCGYPQWEGKDLQIVAENVALSHHLVRGLQTAPETIDAVLPGIAAEMQESTMAARSMGMRFPTLEFTITFHGGSVLEVICENIRIEVRS